MQPRVPRLKGQNAFGGCDVLSCCGPSVGDVFLGVKHPGLGHESEGFGISGTVVVNGVCGCANDRAFGEELAIDGQTAD